MPMAYRPIASTLGYVLSPDRSKVLMVHRTLRDDDEHRGKYNGLGGHLERDEDVASCMIREAREEAGIECTRLTLRGTVNWNDFGDSGDDWIGFIFRIDEFDGAPFERNEDGPLEWVDVARLDDLPMWEGDRLFLPMVFDADPRPFHGFMRYRDDRPVSWSYERL